jgi:hypothetical protein
VPIREIKVTIGGSVIDHGILRSYPVDDGRNYSIPLYKMTVAGEDSAGNATSKDFRVFRFGVLKKTPRAIPKVVGLAQEQTHVIKKYKPDYQVHSASSPENGAWVVHKTFYIHDGADDPDTERFGTIGCVEVVDPSAFVTFNDFLISISGSTKSTRTKKLSEIAASGKMKVTYVKATRPPLRVAP